MPILGILTINYENNNNKTATYLYLNNAMFILPNRIKISLLYASGIAPGYFSVATYVIFIFLRYLYTYILNK